MRESLYDRLRPFKPYDFVLWLLLLAMVTPGSHLSPVPRVAMLAFGVLLFIGLDHIQKWIRSPAPWWQASLIVLLNTLALMTLVYLHSEHRYGLGFSVVNVAFATVAFGQHMGIVAAVLSMASLAELEHLTSVNPIQPLEWILLLAVLLTTVAILMRVNRLQEDALFDAVTGLRNHRFFQIRLREEIERTDRYGKPTSLMLLDLDNFKEVNDRYGHAVGDLLLRSVAELLTKNVRATDMVCRYGGDEMAVILPDTPLHDAGRVADRCREAIANMPFDHKVDIAVCVGVAVYPDHALRADMLIRAADAAMYRAKRSGKNLVVLADMEEAATVTDDTIG
ncbi:MAG: GGDEF domain-containing protein [Gemmataceae bacterium]